MELHDAGYWDDVVILGCQTIFKKTHLIATLFENELKDARVLDLGCGHGRMNRLLQVGEYYGVDQSPGMIRRAEELNKGMGNAQFFRNDAKTLPFRDNFFDIVVCNTVVIHMTKKNFLAYGKEVYRVLKPRGKFIVNVPQIDYTLLLLKEVLGQFEVKELKPDGLEKGFKQHDIIVVGVKNVK